MNDYTWYAGKPKSREAEKIMKRTMNDRIRTLLMTLVKIAFGALVGVIIQKIDDGIPVFSTSVEWWEYGLGILGVSFLIIAWLIEIWRGERG